MAQITDIKAFTDYCREKYPSVYKDASDEEIVNKLRFYLENSQERCKLIEAGLEWSKRYTQQDYARMFVKEAKEFLIDASDS